MPMIPEPYFSGIPLSHWEELFREIEQHTDVGHEPRGVYREPQFGNMHLRSIPREELSESRQNGAGGDEGPDQGTDTETGPERATGAYNAITGTFGIHPATKWGMEL